MLISFVSLFLPGFLTPPVKLYSVLSWAVITGYVTPYYIVTGGTIRFSKKTIAAYNYKRLI